MSRADVAVAILWVGATFYALFGGADFGGGLWDLLAGWDDEQGARPRAVIRRCWLKQRWQPTWRSARTRISCAAKVRAW